jgi:hypothetical protein
MVQAQMFGAPVSSPCAVESIRHTDGSFELALSDGSMKRFAAAVGDGANCVGSIHRYAGLARHGSYEQKSRLVDEDQAAFGWDFV